ncbi:MAG: hypothetical protein ACRDHN_20665, partial [Thermomicrobiales bacterium]
CMGPCMGIADRGVYLGHIRSVLKFMEGDPSDLAEHLLEQIDRAAERLDFEKAHTLRNDLTMVQSVAQSQKEMAYAASHHHALIVLPAPDPDQRTVLVVINGTIWATIQVDNEGDARDLGVRLATAFARVDPRSLARPDHASIDDAIILNRWMLKQSGHPAILLLDLDATAIDWHSMAARVLALSAEELQIDLSVKPRESEDEELENERDRELAQIVRAQAYAEAGDSA